ncbi:MAG: molecular chaperone HtpG [Eubacterium sp.]|nr:molecular chaperone HtpG [Eubacterium sp.]
MEERHGNLSINSDNIFPIIKKWMYSDRDIFIRELVSNGCDAITKRKRLDAIGEVRLPEEYKPRIEVIADDKAKTLKFIDNGIGMTADEVVKDITDIAFSGATEFLEKYKDKGDADQIIGHFGLGFYSAFMVADLVEIDTLSFQEGSEAVHWECDGSTDYTLSSGDRKEAGTTITLHLNEEALEFANEYKVRETLDKYCSFMPVPIFLTKEGAEPQYETIDEKDLKDDDVVIEHIHTDEKTEEKTKDDGTKETVVVTPAKDQVKIQKRPEPVNDIHPLWTKQPSECTDDEYKEFYRHVFLDYKEPLFWIHLNMEYPFHLKGILYFPRINTEYDSIEGKIKLYNNQVFIADNIKEVIPEYMMLLKGVIDCPDLPLNVSRSALQNDGFVEKISNYISKKISDKLSGMFKTKREDYEKYWDDISPFIKYGTLKDEKFSDRMMDYVLYKDIDGKYFSLDEYLKHIKGGEQAEEAKAEGEDAGTADKETEAGSAAAKGGSASDTEAKAENSEADAADGKDKKKEPTTIYYVTDQAQQSQYIQMFRSQGMDAVILKTTIDAPFIQHVEQKKEEVKFSRIDAELNKDLKDEDSESLKEVSRKLQAAFRTALGKPGIAVSAENLKDEKVSSVITLSEESRRMSDMMRMYGMADDANMDMFAAQSTLVLNAKHPLVKYLLDNVKFEEAEVKDEKEADSAKKSAEGAGAADADKKEEKKKEIKATVNDTCKLFCEQLYDLAMISNRPLNSEEMTRFVQRSNKIMLELAK